MIRLGLASLAFLAWLPQQALSVTSTTYRANQNAYVLGEFGSAVVPIPTMGFSVGMNILPNMSAEFSYAEGMLDVDYANLFAKLYSFKLKTFIGNSFYVNTGLGYRVVSDETTDKASKLIKVVRKGRSPGLDMSVGNRWQFGSVSVGCDWLGFFHPLQNTRREHMSFQGRPGPPAHAKAGDPHDHPQSGPPHQGGQRTFDRHQTDWDRLSKYGTLQVMRLSVGIAF